MRQRTTDSGWTELPAIPDMARIQFGQSTCQIEGAYVPVADMNLAAGDSVYFSHHVLLWQDPSVELVDPAPEGGVEPHAGRHAAGDDAGRPVPATSPSPATRPAS